MITSLQLRIGDEPPFIFTGIKEEVFRFFATMRGLGFPGYGRTELQGPALLVVDHVAIANPNLIEVGAAVIEPKRSE
jgi:hypothetical protein